jgi:hypothetical protein
LPVLVALDRSAGPPRQGAQQRLVEDVLERLARSRREDVASINPVERHGHERSEEQRNEHHARDEPTQGAPDVVPVSLPEEHPDQTERRVDLEPHADRQDCACQERPAAVEEPAEADAAQQDQSVHLTVERVRVRRAQGEGYQHEEHPSAGTYDEAIGLQEPP